MSCDLCAVTRTSVVSKYQNKKTCSLCTFFLTFCTETFSLAPRVPPRAAHRPHTPQTQVTQPHVPRQLRLSSASGTHASILRLYDLQGYGYTHGRLLQDAHVGRLRRRPTCNDSGSVAHDAPAARSHLETKAARLGSPPRGTHACPCTTQHHVHGTCLSANTAPQTKSARRPCEVWLPSWNARAQRGALTLRS